MTTKIKGNQPLLSIATRVLVWGTFFGIVYILRSFFLLIFLTFVFTYIQVHGVDSLRSVIKSRVLRVILVGSSFLSVIVALLLFLAPYVRDQAVLFIEKAPSYLLKLDREIATLRETYPAINSLSALQRPHVTYSDEEKKNQFTEWNIGKSESLHLIEQVFGLSSADRPEESLKSTVVILKNITSKIITLSSAFLLSLLFAFLILLDLPALSKQLSDLKHTRLGFVYEEVSDSIYMFCKVLGHALEAQLIIATCNTILTGFVIHYLGLTDKLAFLSTIVFLCSFIPVAGVFISSVPISLLALLESGVWGLVMAAILITIVHLIEAYILNPKIFGKRLHLNPVIVLIILTVSGKLFHVWGLVLGLPIFTYVFGYAIRSPRQQQKF